MVSLIPNRKSRTTKSISLILALSFLLQIVFPGVSYGLTGGPSQPEVESFEPVGTSQMVDPFTGNFTYNIGLLDVDGYPINISYHSGITTDQEASWVGLGWNINPGNITRSMRGMPDDFSGDLIQNEFNMKPNKTWGVSARAGGELFGSDKFSLGYGMGVNYNTYSGISVEQSLSFGLSMNLGKSGQDSYTSNLGLGLKSSSSDGLTVNPSLSFSKKTQSEKNRDESLSTSIGIGTSINSRSGMKALSVDASRSKSVSVTNDKGKSIGSVSRAGGSSSTAITLTPNTYVPGITMPMKNKSYSFNGKIGGELFGITGTFNLAGYFSEQSLEKKEKKTNAYGYLHLEDALKTMDPDALLDFNREKEVPYNKHVKNLPVTNMTYDLFNITGQGVSGMFRSYRNDIPVFYDAFSNNTNESHNLGLEAAIGNAFQAGLDFYTNTVNSDAGVWKHQNPALASQKDAYNGSKPVDFEAAYFKQFGEMVPNKNAAFTSQIGENEAVQIPLATGSSKFDVKTVASFKKKNGTQQSFNTANLIKQNRSPRNQFISHLKTSEIALGGITKYISPYSEPHHIGEVWVTKTDGARYVYGLPAYNAVQREVSFNVAGKSFDCLTGLVQYDPKTASTENNNGADGYFNSTTLPPFAHSYLLTAVVSSDYVDRLNDGLTDDDLGTFTEFKYKKISDQLYKWRVPYEANRANYSEGLKHDPSDDRGSYIYGEKEVWYLDTIKSATQIAVFHTSKRNDAFEVSGEHGGKGALAFHKLDSISLYSRPEFYNNADPTPIKRVHFKYSYTLCPGISNGTGGKLTLEEIYFTYGNSSKGAISPYKFTYADIDHNGSIDLQANPAYNLKAYDRWGNYKQNQGSCEATNTGNVLAAEFPYTEQDRTSYYSSGDYQLSKADVYAQAWSLTSIQLPSGGVINIDYESDDYAYVQDKPAMQMFRNISFGSVSSSPPGQEILYDQSGKKLYLFFDVPGGTTAADIRDKYVRDIKNKVLFFKMMIQTGSADNTYEYVPGYCKIDPSDMGISPYGKGYVKVKAVDKGDWTHPNDKVHPFTKAAWNFVRRHNPRLASGQNDPKANTGDVGIEDLLKALSQSGLVKNMKEFFEGANTTLENKGYGRRIISEKSWVRLYNPNGKKYGGGSRVKRITIGDQWQFLSGDNSKDNFAYGQEFIYENEDGSSSGVASYEPMAGGEENPFRMPVFIREQNLLAPDGEHYLEEPFGESYFPSPGVGYSRVEIRNIAHDDVNRGATGHEVKEFYTAKDFPTKTSRTFLDPKPAKSNSLSNLLNLTGVKDYMTTSQGYAIELNDMHGKPKSFKVYGNADTGSNPPLISGTDYIYKTNLQSQSSPAGNINSLVLDNNITVLKPDGTVQSNIEVGVEQDIATDYREHNTYTESVGNNGNLNAFLAAIWPVAIPLILPNKSNQHTRYRSVVTTKVTNRFGMLREVISYDLGTRVSQENLAWDSETGEVLLTRVNNQFNDPVYSLKYPAHWGYDGMGQAYKNDHVSVAISTNLNGKITSTPNTYLLTDGDLVSLGGQGNGWIKTLGPHLHLIDKDGNGIGSYNDTVKVLHSGRGNQQGQPIMNIVCKENPLDHLSSSGSLQIDENLGILTTGATEYSDEWQVKGNEVYYVQDGNKWEPTPMGYAMIDFFNALISGGDFYKHGHLSSIGAPGTFYYDDITNKYLNHHSTINTYMTRSASYSKLEMSYSIGLNNNADAYMFRFFYDRPAGTVIGGRAYGTPLLEPENYSSDWSQPGFDWSQVNYFSTDSVHVASAYQGYAFGGSHLRLKAHMNDGSIEPVILWDDYLSRSIFMKQKLIEVCGLTTFNPFLKGVRGYFKPQKTYTYITERSQSALASNSNVNTREDGTYELFKPMWDYYVEIKDSNWVHNGNDTTTYDTIVHDFFAPYVNDWTLTQQVTRRNHQGREVENRDPLGIYSTALFGYADQLPVAVISNSRYSESGFDSFEDYSLINGGCSVPHFKFEDRKSFVTDLAAHSGKYSLRLESPLALGSQPSVISREFAADVNPDATGGEAQPYAVQARDVLPTFSPLSGVEKEYVLSFWILKTKFPVAEDFDYSNDFSLVIKIDNGGSVTTLSPGSLLMSDMVDGWQQFTYTFTIPSNTSPGEELKLEFRSAALGYTDVVYLDDIRIHPAKASMRSFVYDPQNLRFVAELDENNFATFYEYDQEGKLVRVKKETEKGIVTVKESRNNSSKTRLYP